MERRSCDGFGEVNGGMKVRLGDIINLAMSGPGRPRYLGGIFGIDIQDG